MTIEGGRRLVTLALAWLALTGAAPLPLKPPPPDLLPLIPWVAAPLDKPAIEPPRVTLPAPPLDATVVAPAPIVVPAAPRPLAPLPAPRTLPCVGAWLKMLPSESLECGRARLLKGELEDARRALEHAARTSTDPEIGAEARYWHAEALDLLGRVPDADWSFRQAAEDPARGEYGPWAVHGSGWTALRLGDASRAEGAFRRLLGERHPALLDAWGRHGLALALYALGRWPEAEKVWAELASRRVPSGLERDLLFWHGETLGRAGRPEHAADGLRTFVQGGPHALLAVGHVRRGWWLLTAGRPADAVPAFRAFLLGPPPSVGEPAQERDWAEAGLALALVATGDTAGARAALRGLDARRVPLAMAVRLRLAARAVEGGRPDEAEALAQELLAGSLNGPLRAWVLAVKGDAHRAGGDRDEARTQFDLARQAHSGSAVARYATYRLAQMNFELREFSQAAADLAPLLAAPTDGALRVSVLLLTGEAAYQAGDFATATDAYRRALVEFPDHPQAPATRLALGWTALRRGQRDAALRQFLDFARVHTADPRAPDGLILAAELMLAAGSLDDAREVLDRILTAHPTSPRAEFARFNRILIAARAGDTEVAQRALRAWIVRAPFPALIGRAWTTLGATLLGAGRASDAGAAFARAVQDGADATARLGLGAVALLEERWDDAAREFTAARDLGTPAVAAVAEYGLGAVAFHRGRPADFKPAALAALTAAPRGRPAPRLLYMLVGLAVEDKDWPAALGYARRLAAEFPKDEAADDAFERIVAGAAAAQTWPVVRDAYTLLRQHEAQSPFVAASRLAYAHALLEVGQADEARRALEEFVTATPQDPRVPRALMILGRAREAAGDRRGALEAFGRAVQQGASPTTDYDGYLAYARALTAERRWDQARPVLERVLGSADGAVAAEVAVALGESWAAQAEPLTAVEYYMTAAYLEPESPRGRRALLAAGRSFTAARNPEAAAIVYRKLLAQSGLPADLAESARQALAALRR